MTMCSSEDSDLKRLLTSWHCEILYNLFREEDITTEELKYIKYRHVNCLLRNYKMGVRIRFEHYLESWRNKIGIPFLSGDGEIASKPMACSCQWQQQAMATTGSTEKQMSLENHVEREHIKSNASCGTETAGETDTIESHNANLLSPRSLTESTHIQTDHIPPQARSPGNAGHMLRSTGRRREREPPPLEGNENLIASYLATTDSPGNNNHNITSRNNFEKSSYSLAQILHMSGSRGTAIIKYYEEHGELTITQRAQLIQAICDFYEENDFHLSLNMSHAIETEILKMFPTEKLHFYRTEKRGKLYVKFTNMKRYRRERGTIGRARAVERGTDLVPFNLDRKENQIRVENMAEMTTMENNMDTSCDTWPEGAEADINIKTEELEDS